MVDHVGVIAGLVVVLAATLLWLVFRTAGRPPSADSSADDPGVEDSPVALHWLGALVLFVVWQTLALLLALWALAYGEVGGAAAAALVVPTLVGFAFAWRKGVLKW